MDERKIQARKTDSEEGNVEEADAFVARCLPEELTFINDAHSN